MTQRLASVLAPALLGASLIGCAQQVGDIDRTQPNKIEVSAFEGEWYYQQTVVDINATALSAFPGLQGNLQRVRFFPEERQMVVRRAYEDVIGLDTSEFNSIRSPDWDAGAPVAVFPVISYFDVQRNYNPVTGEQQNVLIENNFDRPWFQRDWVRLDFTRNLVNQGFDWFIDIQNMSSVIVSPQDEVENPTWFIERDSRGQVVYIDVLNTYMIQPDVIECLLTFGVPLDGSWCGPETVTVRSSFVKILEESDHIPVEYDDFDMNRFGYFRTVRCVYDRRHGCMDDTRQALAAVWNIWDRNRDANGDPLPYAERGVRPIPFYLNMTYPRDLIGVTFDSTEQWSYAFRRVVAGRTGQNVQDVPRMFYMCMNPGTIDPEPPAEFLAAVYTDEQKELVREAFAASAEGYQLGVCRNEGVEKRVGDLRYSMINWANNGAFIPWGGYGPSSQDPLTGETIQGASNLNGANYDESAQRTLYIVDIILGRITPNEYADGEYLLPYLEELRERTNNDIYLGYLPDGVGDVGANKSNLPAQLAAQQRDVGTVQANLLNQHALDQVTQEIQWSLRHHDRLRNTAMDLLQRPEFLARINTPIDQLRIQNGLQRSRLHLGRGTIVEQAMITEEIRTGMGLLLDTAVSRGGMTEDEALEILSPIRFASPDALRRHDERLRNRFLDRNICALAEDFDPYMYGFAQEIAEYRVRLENEFGLSGFELEQEIWRYARARLIQPVIEHEIGHTVGLRHNFEGSFDAMNYNPQYWRLREMTFDEDCSSDGYRTFSADGMVTGVVAPRRCSGQTTAEQTAESAEVMRRLRVGLPADGGRTQAIYEYQYSSIMDYDSKPNTQSAGLGLYDYAAIAYGYGRLVEVFTNDAIPHRIDVTSRWNPTTDSFLSVDVTRSSQRVRTMRDVDNYTIERNGIIAGDVSGDRLNDNRWTHWHYSVLPIMFDGLRDSIDTSNPATQYHRRIDYEGVRGMAAMYNRELIPEETAIAENRVIVPYRFCSDEYRGSSSVCNIFDLGADEYEVYKSMVDTYDSYYVSQFFRRQRPGFGLWLFPVLNGMLFRYFDPARRLYQFWLLNYSASGFDWLNSPRGGLNQYLAALDSINFIASTMNTPTVGTFVWDEPTGTYRNVSDRTDFTFPAYDPTYPDLRENDYMRVGITDGGRYGFSRFLRNQDGDLSYYRFYQTEVASHFWAKYAATIAITSGEVDVIGVDTQSDATAFFLAPYLVFEDELINYFGAIISEDLTQVGWCVKNEDGRRFVEPIEMIRGNNDPGCEGSGGRLMNPHTNVFGNRDFNMQLFGIIFAAAQFPALFDMDWLDRSAVYIWGRAEQPAIYTEDMENPDFEWLTYTTVNGMTYAARYRSDHDFSDRSPRNANPGLNIVQSMIDLQVELDHACPYQFQSAGDLQFNCRMTEADRAEYLGLNGPYEGRDFFQIRNELERLAEMARFQLQTNMIYNGF
jgi:hypothetical protein